MKKSVITIISLAVLFPMLGVGIAHALIGPGNQSAGSGGGVLMMDASGNIGFGTNAPTPVGNATEAKFGRVFTIASSSDPGISLKNLSAGGHSYTMYSRANGRLAIWDDTTASVRFIIEPNGNIGINSGNPASSTLSVMGNISATAGISGDIYPSSIIGGAFQSANYAFPSQLAVGTTTTGLLPGQLYVNGDISTGGNVITMGGATPGSGAGNTLKMNSVSWGQNTIAFQSHGDSQYWHYINSYGLDSAAGYKDVLEMYNPGNANEDSVIRLRTGASGINKGSVQLWTDNTERLRVNGLGNVGVGTTTPATPLSVVGTTTITAGNLKIGTTGYGVAFPDGTVQTSAASGGYWSASSTNIYNNNAGKVGIGTANPVALLDVYKDTGINTDEYLRLSTRSPSGGAGGRIVFKQVDVATPLAEIISVAGGGYIHNTLSLNVQGSTMLYLMGDTLQSSFPAGNVGIGTTTPSTKLNIHVGSQVGLALGDPATAIKINATNDAGSAYGGIVWKDTDSAGTETIGLYPERSGARNSLQITDNQTKLVTLRGGGGGPYLGIGNDIPSAKLEISMDGTGLSSNYAMKVNSNDNAGGDLFSILGNGAVGIGTSTPLTAKLVITPGASPSIDAGGQRVINVGTPIFNNDAVNKTYVDSVAASSTGYWIANGASIYNNNGGNVGIGTTTPATTLSVAGSSTISGNLEVGGTITGNFTGTNSGATLATGVRGNGGVFGSAYDAAGTNYRFNDATNTALLMIDAANGRVGVGTQSPSYKFHVAGDGFFEGDGSIPNAPTIAGFGFGRSASDTNRRMEIVTPANGISYIDFTNPSVDFRGRIYYDTASNFFSLYTNTSEKVRIDSSGNMGIGVTAPSAKLEVNGNIYAGPADQIRIIGADNGGIDYVAVAGSALKIQTTANNNNIALLPHGTGGVGIGTTTPSTNLSVVGSSTISGNLAVGGTITGTFTGTNSGATLASSVRGNGGVFGSSYDAAGTNYRFNDASNTALLYVDATNGRVGVGTASPGTKLQINQSAAASTRESLFKGAVSDAGNDAFYIVNGTSVDGRFAPTFSGYVDSSNIPYSINFRGMTSAANDASDSSTVGLINFEAMRTDSAVDPNNGNMAAIQNRKLLTVTNNSNNVFTILAGGNVGIGTTTPTSKLQVQGNADMKQVVIQGNSTQNANLEEWQNNAGTLLLGITGAGYVQAPSADNTIRIKGNGSGQSVTLEATNSSFSEGTDLILRGSSPNARSAGSVVLQPSTYGTSAPYNQPGSVVVKGGKTVAGSLNFRSGDDLTGTFKQEIYTTATGLRITATQGTGAGWMSPGQPVLIEGGTSYGNGSSASLNNGGDVYIAGGALGGNGSTAPYGTDGNVILAHSGSAARGNVGISTLTPTTARLVIVPGAQPSIDAGNQRIINIATPIANNDAVNKTYVDSAISSATSSGTWITNGSNIYNGNAGNVGVGTSTPTAYKLQVAGTFSADNNNVYSDGVGNLSAVSFYDKNSPTYFLDPSATVSMKTAGSVGIGMSGAPSGKLDIANDASNFELYFSGTGGATNIYSANTANPMYINTNGAPIYLGTGGSGSSLLNIVSNNVGINTTNPTQGQLQISDSSGASAQRGLAVTQHNNGVQGALINFLKSRGTETVPLTVGGGDYGGIFTFQNYDGSAYRTNASWGYRTNGTIGANSIPGELFFAASQASDNDPYTNGSVRMVIKSSGNVGIGTTTPSTNLSVVGSSTISGNLAVGGTITGTFTGTNSGATLASSVRGNGAVFGSSYDAAGTNYRFNDASNTALFYVDATNGRVGVGTAAPTSLLDVYGANPRITSRRSGASGNYASYLATSDTSGYPRAGFYIGDSSGDSIANAGLVISPDVSTAVQKQAFLEVRTNPVNSASEYRFMMMQGTTKAEFISSANAGSDVGTPIYFSTQGTNYTTPGLYVSNGASQNVGVGTASPQAALHVNGNILIPQNKALEGYYGGSVPMDLIGIDGNADTYIYANGNNSSDIYFSTVSSGVTSTKAAILNSGTAYFLGSVGIGTTTPSNALTVLGNGSFSGNITATGIGSSVDVNTRSFNTYALGYSQNSGTNTYLFKPFRLVGHIKGKFVIEGNDAQNYNYGVPGGDVFISGGTDPYFGNGDGNVILGHNGTVARGNVGISTTTPTTARLVITPGAQPAIDAGNQRIINIATPIANNDAVNKTYVDSAIMTATSSGVWTTSGANIYNANAGNVGVGTTTAPAYKFSVNGSFGADTGNIYSDGLGNLNALSFIDKASPAYYLQPSGAVSLKTAGNVGIGTAGTPTGSGIRKVEIAGTGGGVNDYGSLALSNTSGSGNNYAGAIDYYTQGNLIASMRSQVVSTGNTGILNFYTANGGTLLPRGGFDQNGLFSASYGVAINKGLWAQETTGLTIGNHQSSATSHASLAFTSINDFGTVLDYAKITGVRYGTWNSTNRTGGLSFSVINNATTYTEALRIDNTGHVGIGTTTPATELSVIGSSTISGNLAVGGTITGTFTGTNSGATMAASVRGGGGVFGSSYDAAGTNYRFNDAGNNPLLYIDATNGRIGIGTASPRAYMPLDIRGSDTSGNGVGISVLNSATTGQPTAGISLLTGTGTGTMGGTIGGSSFANSGYGIVNGLTFRTASGTQDIGFSTGPEVLTGGGAGSRMIIKADGKVGVGTLTPTVLFQVGSTTYTGGETASDRLRVVGSAPLMIVEDFRTPGNSPFSALDFRGLISSGAASIRSLGMIGAGKENATEGNENAYLTLSTRTHGLGDTEKMRITSAGYVGIGTSTPATKLQILDGTLAITGSTWSSNNVITFGDDSSNAQGKIVYYNNGDRLSFWTPAGDTMSLSSTGNAGIGTTTPTTARLVIVPGAQPSIDAGNQRIINIATPIANNDAVNKTYVDSAIMTATSSGVWTTSGANIYNTNSGHVGIGFSSAPAYDLTVSSTMGLVGGAMNVDNFGNLSATSFLDSGSPSYFLDPSGAVSMKTAGSVGIGMSGTPSNALSVNGNIDASKIVVGTSAFVGTEALRIRGGNPNVLFDTASTAGRLQMSMNSGTGSYGELNFGTDGIQGGTAVRGYNADNILSLITNSTERIRITSSGNVGIGTSTPSSALTVNGTLTLLNGGNIAMTGNIGNVTKLTVQTIDPLYEIAGKKYATYAASIAGGVKEEFVGRGRLIASEEEKDASYTVDFTKVEEGSDLWVWYQAVDFNNESVEVFATPNGGPASIWYEIVGTKIIFHSDRPAEMSYRLIGKRHDWTAWPTFAKDQTEAPSFIINKK